MASSTGAAGGVKGRKKNWGKGNSSAAAKKKTTKKGIIKNGAKRSPK